MVLMAAARIIEFPQSQLKPLQTVDLALLAEVRGQSRGWPEKTNVGVTFLTTSPVPGMCVSMDPDHLRTIPSEPPANAHDAMPGWGAASLTVAYDASHHQLRFASRSGPHLRATCGRVGRPFFSTKPGAVGLGLALTKALSRAYEGNLRLKTLLRDDADHLSLDCEPPGDGTMGRNCY